MAGKKESGTYIAIHHFVIFFSTGVDEWLVVSNADIVDQDIHCTELLFCNGNGPYRRLLLTDISNYCNSSTTCGLDRLHQFIETVLAPGSQYKIGSFVG